MLCLGIETSCDETGLALVSDGRLVREALASQEDVHAVFGGVVPEIASREHLRIISPLLSKLLADEGLKPRDIDVVAVARGPGLLGCLLIGMGLAKGFALGTGAALVGVNHLHAHLAAVGLERELVFPALGLLASGGHTQLYHIRSETEFTELGRTLDDAAGEAFDKAAKTLNLPYPGGRYIDVLGRETAPDKTLFTRPYLDNQNCDFSFSGLKTAVAGHVAAHPELRSASMPSRERAADPEAWPESVRTLCASLNWTIADTLRVKLARALKRTGPVKSLIVAGGVAANSRIRAMAADAARAHGLELLLPSSALCTDNGAMIAHLGERLARAGFFHDQTLDAVPRGRKVPQDYTRSSTSP